MCVLGVLVALALVQPWGRRVPRRLITFCAWSGTGLLVLRAGASVIQTQPPTVLPVGGRASVRLRPAAGYTLPENASVRVPARITCDAYFFAASCAFSTSTAFSTCASRPLMKSFGVLSTSTSGGTP